MKRLEAVRVLVLVTVVGLFGGVVTGQAWATSYDVMAAGQQYCADSYTVPQNHPSYFGATNPAWVVDINFPGDAGAPIYAPEAGTVTIATTGFGGGWGNSIVWTNQAGTERLHMAHLASFGQTGAVSAGAQIGTIGNTGTSSGAHLHISRQANGANAPVVLSGQTLNPSFRPDATYGAFPCAGATYTSIGQAPSGPPPPPAPPPDADDDGIPDAEDACARYANRQDPHGCQEEGASGGGLSDYNGDGLDDLVGIYEYAGQNPSMRMWLFPGHASGLFGPAGLNVHWRTDGSWSANLSRFVSGDFNGDRIADLAGIYEYPGHDPAIRIWLFPGHRASTAGPESMSVHWQTDGSWSGNLSRFLSGDFNGDGISDIVGVYEYPGQTPSMRLWLFPGHRTGTQGPSSMSVHWQTDGSWDGKLARFVSGDFNGDRITDIVGIYRYPGQDPSMRMWLFPGHASGTRGPSSMSVHWQTDGSWDGNFSRFSAGDFNGDGITDLAGIYEYPGSNPSMRMWLFPGHASGVQGPSSMSVHWQTDGSWDGRRSRFTATDANADGITDLVGIYEYPGQSPSMRMWLFPGHVSGVQGPSSMSVHWQTDGSWDSRFSRFISGGAPPRPSSPETPGSGTPGTNMPGTGGSTLGPLAPSPVLQPEQGPAAPVRTPAMTVRRLKTTGRRLTATVDIRRPGTLSVSVTSPSSRRSFQVRRSRVASPRALQIAWQLPRRVRSGAFVVRLTFRPDNGNQVTLRRGIVLR